MCGVGRQGERRGGYCLNQTSSGSNEHQRGAGEVGFVESVVRGDGDGHVRAVADVGAEDGDSSEDQGNPDESSRSCSATRHPDMISEPAREKR